MVDYRKVLVERRIELGMSQYKLAKILGIAQSYVSELERGRKRPSIELFFRICEVLNLEVIIEKRSDP